MIDEKIITDFSKGMINDSRIQDFSYSQLLKNFETHTWRSKLVPRRQFESGDSAASTSQKRAFCIALRTGTTYSLYALGVKSGATTAEVLYKDLTVNATNDLSDNGWTAPAANQSAAGATDFNLFVYYKNLAVPLIYGSRAKQYIWSFDPAGGAWVDTVYDAGAFTNITQGLVHSKDDILYFGIDNKIVKKNGAAAFTVALTFPTDKIITSICEYGNFLAIGTKHVSGNGTNLSGFGNSVVYLWDRDSSLTTLSESIDWGEGALQILEQLEGRLIGISFLSSTANMQDTLNTPFARGSNKIVFREYNGGTANIFTQFINESASYVALDPFKQKVNQYLYFLLNITINGQSQRGLWKIGRNNPSEPFSVVIDRQIANTEGNTPNYGFFVVGDFVFISYSSSGGATPNSLSKTDDVETYLTAIYESQIYNANDSSKKKKLIGVSIMTEALPAAGQVVLKYRKDEETSWTTIFTNTTANSISYSAVNIESSGAMLPEFKEIQFRIESSGGAVITGLKWKAEIMEKDKY